jgi:hypothetical protein
MGQFDPPFARSLADAIMDRVFDSPCADDGFRCTLRWILDDISGTVMLVVVCVVLGFVGAVLLAPALKKREVRPQVRSGVRQRPRVLSGPIHSDGAWIRLVEDEHGGRFIEQLVGGVWRPLSSERSLASVPVSLPRT